MTKVQWRALAVCSWLIAFCFGLAGAAAFTDYLAYRGGDRAAATVDRVEGDLVTLRFKDPMISEVREHQVSKDQLDDAARGATVDLLIYRTNRNVILAGDLSHELPSLWVVLGLALSTAGGLWLWRIPNRQAERRAARKTSWEAVIAAAARTRNMALGMGIFCLAAGALFAVIPLVDREGGVAALVFIWALAAATIYFGVQGLRRAHRLRNPERNEIVDLVEQRPAELAWFYVQRIVTNGIGATETLSLVLCKSDGKRLALALVPEDHDGVLAEIARRAPHAQQGYDRELERQWREDPGRWRPR